MDSSAALGGDNAGQGELWSAFLKCEAVREMNGHMTLATQTCLASTNARKINVNVQLLHRSLQGGGTLAGSSAEQG